jgi:hypothetical protein
MLVFGDRAETVDPRERLDRLARGLAAAGAATDRAGRETQTAALVEAGMLAQGLADAEFAVDGEDRLSDQQARALAFVGVLAGEAFDPASAARAARALAAADLPSEIVCRTPEGFSVYGVYPDAYRMTAAKARLDRPLVIGLRSIGLPLAAAAAAGASAEQVVTLRPHGDAFRRQVRVSDELGRRLTGHQGDILIVDEGPGLSGSSFNATADLLQDLGVAEDRLVFMPSHDGDLGTRASAAHRRRWSRARRTPATLDALLARDPLAGWFEDLTGPILRVEDLSGGVWRRDLPPSLRPPAWRLQERRKMRITAERGVFLARFAGLGRLGAVKLEIARSLHAAGFAPEPLALRRGFLLERWIEGEPLAVQPAGAGFLERLTAYLAFRARHAPSGPGADADELRAMTLTNVGLLGGAALSRAVERRLTSAARLTAASRPLAIDGRLHPWEWRRDAAGRIWKTDAIDHAFGHDLVGCQDIGWDVAGATVEFALSQQEAAGVAAAVGRAQGRQLDPEVLRTFEFAYCAFQAGLWTYAAEDPQEARGAQARIDLYRRRLLDLSERA